MQVMLQFLLSCVSHSTKFGEEPKVRQGWTGQRIHGFFFSFSFLFFLSFFYTLDTLPKHTSDIASRHRHQTPNSHRLLPTLFTHSSIWSDSASIRNLPVTEQQT